MWRCGNPYDRTVTVEQAARRWAETWLKSWLAKDADLLAPLYGDDTVFRSHPFRAPQPPLDYARWAYGEQEGDAEVWFGEPLVAADAATVEWWACLVENGEPTSLAGVSILRFDDDGRVVEQHDYWNSAPGRNAPWEGWSTSGP
jgi:SnoaL-like protein